MADFIWRRDDAAALKQRMMIPAAKISFDIISADIKHIRVVIPDWLILFGSDMIMMIPAAN